ncbi:uncharacterized protein BCR38DRAFT_102793 [Pseudomassariella vexata]|uniref:Rhodopsin domain-containing protein n=1 Tax=Pseudomassariella vexata TaxID=1141098 RepID=A0A1Y2EHH5_9PEZI|nr:uncharacterized protein BCR38DRAFT_102793 [Pseudomassariella vexata]ORY70235.1 hypothetical protein BCR38DRAFT_102793 [Pseudomassariella vexata]
MTGLVTGLDALSDILIATIPIIIIHRARLRTMQKISLGMFLCLNLVMVCLAITRVSKIHGAAGVDVPWEFFWQYIEAAVAVMMGSLTVVRSLFALRDERNRARVAVARPRPLAQSFFNRVRLLHNNKEHVGLESHDNDALPEVPSATMMGLRTFIRRNNRDSGSQMTQVPLEGISQQDTVVELDNYNSRQDAVAELDNPQGYPVAELDSARPTVMYEQPRFDSNRRVHE